ncbi:thioredoxin domain-containing protein [Henriciella aquimarina]|uniref:thioredoxin domain-containing protein n=1 Tax=Henriciella aquimarina TaxID=545261 RepID=UPI000A07267E|nr:thioredoxin domain-containing protein [Henriciella aquimarina]
MVTTSQHIVCTACGQTNRIPSPRTPDKGHCGRCGTTLAVNKPVDIDAAMLAKLQARDEGIFVLDVWAPWCGPCRMMAPAYEQAASHFGGAVRFFKIDSQAHPEAGSRLQVRGIPALFLFKDGRIIAQQAGAQTRDALIGWIEQTATPKISS